jgi:hypothetical protein
MGTIGGHHVKWSKPDLERQRTHVFSHLCKIYPKYKYKHKNKHDHIQTIVKHVCDSGSTL